MSLISIRPFPTTSLMSGRTLVIRKMRGTQHSEDIHPMEFVTGKGIIVKKVEDL